MRVKDILRKKHIRMRENLSCSEKKIADRDIFEILKKHPHIVKNKHIMVYVSVSGEVDTHHIISYLLSAGKRVYIPVIEENEIRVSEIKDINELVPGKFDIPEPPVNKRIYADPAILDVVIVPGVCFTPEGYRLGRGGGYYDRFLKRISENTLVLGICYRAQMENEIPHDEKDVKVHEIISR